MAKTPDVMKTMGATLKALREARGWTLVQLSEKSGIDDSYLGKMERGQRGTTPRGYAGLARALGVPLHRLFTDSGHESTR